MNLNFVINASTITAAAYYSLLEKMIVRLKKLNEQFGNVDSAELQLYETFEDENLNDKVAILKINCREHQLMEYSVSRRWEDAILNAFDGIYYNATGRFN